MEVWLKIRDFDYEVSNQGNVRSIDNDIIRKDGKKLKIKGRKLKPKLGKYGYLSVSISKNGKQYYFLIQRLVATAFIPNPNKHAFVNHKDEIKSNNYEYNLEWCNSEYNNNYGTRGQRISCKLKKKIVYKLNDTIQIFDSINDASKSLNYSISYISLCCNNKRSPKKYSLSFI